jgi:oligopeptide transport system substrate-binding protein
MKSINKMRLMGVVASVGLLGMALTGCSTQAAPTVKHVAQQGDTPVYGGTLTMDVSEAFPHLDPALAYDTTSGEVVYQMYNQLVSYQGSTNNIVPMLASSYTVSPDGKTYKFKLKDAKFWNGHPVTADSFIAEFKRVLTKTINSPGVGFIDQDIVGAADYENGKAKSVSGLKSLDGGKTLEIDLKANNSTFLYVLAMSFFSAVDPSYVNANPEAYVDYHPMGTGAFELSKYKPNIQWTFTKNPHYFVKGLPYLNSIVFNYAATPQVELLHFEQGSSELMSWNAGGTGIPSEDYLPMMMKYKNQTATNVQVATDYIGLNTKTGFTANPLVRKAIAYAINKDEFLKILNGRGVIANQVIPSAMPSAYVNPLPADATYNYDVKKAKELLKEAGFPNGFKTTIYTQNKGARLKIGIALQQMLSKVGITATIDGKAWGTFLKNNETGTQSIFVLGWFEDFPDPSDFLNVLLNSNQIPVNNSTNYHNVQVDKWLNQAATMPDGAARNDLYKKAGIQVMKDVPWVPFAYTTFTSAVQPYVKGLFYNPNLMDPLYNVWIAKH